MSTNKCPSCGLVNFHSEVQCGRCGAHLQAGGGGGAPFFSGCHSCGSPLSVTDQNCPSCRAPVLTRAEPPRRVEPLVAQRPAQTHAPNLAQCPDCGHMVSRAALSCPSCGRPSAHAAPVYHMQPMLVTPAYHPVLVTHTKSRGVYIVLALFLGCLGVHNFYAGYNGRGAAQLIITLLTGCAGGFFITGLWALVECFVINTDSYGRRMT